MTQDKSVTSDDADEDFQYLREVYTREPDQMKFGKMAVCLICAIQKNIDVFKTVLPPYPHPITLWEMKQPTPPSKKKPLQLSHPSYSSYHLVQVGIGVCFSCSDSIRIMQKAALIAGQTIMKKELIEDK